MICKKDVILWFKELESYKRIDTMCTLLNMCLPFELRFLGTCLEELGRRDSQELRGMELRVNNPQDLAADMVACQKGEPTDKKIRRKMALYLALIRACNRTCVAEIFRTLDGWGERDFYNMNDSDTLQELLLVYTMAAHHPVFSFEQHLKCTEIFEKIKENKLVCDPPPTTPPILHTLQQHIEQHHATMVVPPNMPCQQQHQPTDLRQHLPPPSHQELLQQHAMHAAAMHLSAQHPQLLPTVLPQVLPQGSIAMNFPQGHLTKLIPADGSIQHPISVDNLQHMITTTNITIPADSNTMLTHPNATWPLRPFPPQAPTIEHPPQSSSPMLSQQSSPSSSRTTSPNRVPSSNILQQQNIQTTQQQQQHQGRNINQRIVASMKGMRRPSTETTPPPMGQQQQQHQQQQIPHAQMMSNEMIFATNMKLMDEISMHNDASGNQLQTLIRNGYARPGHHTRIKAGSYISQHPPPQQQQQSPVSQHFQTLPATNFAMNTGLAYTMQNMSLGGDTSGGSTHSSIESGLMGGSGSVHSNKSAGSDSGSSIESPGERSPSETPTLMLNATVPNVSGGSLRMVGGTEQQQKHHQTLSYNQKQQLNLMRLNGRSDKMLPVNVCSGSGIVSSGANIIYAPAALMTNAHQTLTQQQQQQTQQLFSTGEIILAPGGNAGTASLMHTAAMNANNNNAGGGGTVGGGIGMTVTNANTVTCNNNLTTNTVLISTPSAGAAAGLLGNVITSNSAMLLPSPQPQYNTTYPYPVAAAQHLAAAGARPPLMTHNPGLAPPPPPGTFRHLPGFPLQPNGEIMYSAYHPVAFLSSGAPPGATPVALRSSNPASLNVAAATAGIPPPQLGTQQAAPQQLPGAPTGVPSAALLTAAPYSTLSVGVTTAPAALKPLSCYNCGSQTHSGRDCQEASMDDVTRPATYKLDYTGTASSNTSPTAGSGPSITMGGGSSGGGGAVAEAQQQQSQHLLHHSKQHSTDGSGVNVTATTNTPPTAATVLASSAVAPAGQAVGALNTK